MRENDNTKKVCVVLLFLFCLTIYYFTGLNSQSSPSLEDYPFGADTPFYSFNLATDDNLLMRHTTTVLLGNWFNDIAGNAKAFYAVCGALAVVLSYGVFSLFFNTRLSFICSGIYGFSLSIWFFSSFPECYIVTTVFVNLYIYAFLRTRNGAAFPQVSLSLILILSVANDITSLMLLLLPVVYFNKRLLFERQLLQTLALHAFAMCAISFAILSYVSYKYHHGSVFEYYREFAGKYTAQQYTWRDIPEPLYNSLIFDVAAPDKVISFHTKLFPWYKGFFKPSLVPYLKYLPSLLLFVMYVFLGLCAVLRIVRYPKELGAFQITLLTIVALRIVVFSCFVNPGEAFLYSSVLVFPLLFVLFASFQKTFPDHVDHFLAVFLVLLIATNLRFFICSNYI